MSAYTSPYPITFDAFLRNREETLNTSASGELSKKYETYDIWLRAAFDSIQDFCNQRILAIEDKEYFFNMDELLEDNLGRYYQVPVFRVPFELTSLKYRTGLTSDYIEFAGTLYTVENEGGIYKVYFKNAPSGVRGKAIADIGFTDEDLPPKIRQVAVEMMREVFDESGMAGAKNRLALLSEGNSGQGGSSTTAYFQLRERHKIDLKPYRLELP